LILERLWEVQGALVKLLLAVFVILVW